MNKKLIMPLIAVIVAAGGAIAMNGKTAHQDAWGEVAPGDCRKGTLVEPEDCAINLPNPQCQVEIGGQLYPAFATEECSQEDTFNRITSAAN